MILTRFYYLHINVTHFKMIFEIRLLQREKEKYNLINRVNGTFTFTSNFETWSTCVHG